MKRLAFAAAALAAAVAGAWQQAPGMKTPWGEKVTPENAWREYPRPQMARDAWTNLNGLWQYAVTRDAPGVPKAWDGEILVPFVIESPLSGVGRLLEPQETLWYRRSFDADVQPGTRLLLHFEQADFRAMVFVNGVEAGVPHEGGQMPFTYDVTDLVRKGANELVVSVWDPTTDFIGSHGKQTFRPHGCMYTRSSGIGGTVWLETVPATHIADYRVTADIDAGTVRFEFDVAGGRFAKPEVRVSVLCDGGNAVATTKDGVAVVKMPAGFKLWSPESPALYDFTATCGEDTVKGYFGMRKFELRKDPNGVLRFYFNNKARFIIGTLDQGWWPDGLLTPPSEEAMAYDIRALKKMGFDMMRKHIKVEPRRYYALCDRLGILVLQDMPSGFSDREKRYGFYRRELKEMMDHLQKTPSVVMWVPYNEGWGQPGPFLTHATLMWTQRYDPTRLVDGPSGAHDWEGGAIWMKPHRTTSHLPAGEEEAAHAVDKHDYGQRPKMHALNSRRASFLGEFGGIGCRVEGHLWTTNAWGYGNTGRDVDRKAVQAKFVSLMEHVAGLAEAGLAGSVYTQTTDVEGEINGLLTYDRRVEKFDAAALAAVHGKVRAAAARGLMPRVTHQLLPRLDPDSRAWAWTTEEPSSEWTQPTFNDSAWARACGGFGNKAITQAYAHAKVNTDWSTKTIWLRRHFNYAARPEKLLRVTAEMFHDEDAEIYLNGKLVLDAPGYNTDWTAFTIPLEAFAAAVKKGDNVLAVKVKQEVCGQYFDLGLSLDVAK
ncbi:MAG: beta galactosidase jelly roll domain-containing protein [Kiritimatiellae bacterium]|nr:beta galactosidase jelly roll domain-containing protein [Kiritimatiellia bacterium]